MEKETESKLTYPKDAPIVKGEEIENKLTDRVEGRLEKFCWEKCMDNLNHAPYILCQGARFSGKSHGIVELVWWLEQKLKYKNFTIFYSKIFYLANIR